MIKQLLLIQNNDKFSKKEIFGPVVCINEYDDIEKAIENANSVKVSFQASIFSNEIK